MTQESTDRHPLALDADALWAAGLVEIAALSPDLQGEPVGEVAGRKRRHLDARLDELKDVAIRAGRSDQHRQLRAVTDVERRRRAALICLGESAPPTGAAVPARIGLDLVASSPWPEGLTWRARPEHVLATPLGLLDPALTPERISAIGKAHHKTCARLARASVSTQTKVTLGLGSLALTAVSAGVAAPALGTAIGGAMGLSGAAATSAGLAFLGGGSIASGGFGMAGGIILVKITAGLAYKGSTYVATGIAATSRAAFIHEVAKLHVGTRLAEPFGGLPLLTSARQHLDELATDLQRAESRATTEQRKLKAALRT